jgi:hypothetical protein
MCDHEADLLIGTQIIAKETIISPISPWSV